MLARQLPAYDIGVAAMPEETLAQPVVQGRHWRMKVFILIVADGWRDMQVLLERPLLGP